VPQRRAVPGRSAFAAGAAAGPGGAGSRSIARAALTPASEPLPECRYADVRTRFRSVSKWKISLLDTELKVTRRYVPPDLVPVSNASIAGSGMVRDLIVDDLHAMAQAAKRAGNAIAVRSAYRSYNQQAAVFRSWVDRVGYDAALRSSARAGHSEHQLGTTIDFRSGNSARAPWEYPDWATTPAGAWMAENAWAYGFVMSYPKGKSKISCYEYEPWHYRYFGRSLAAKIHDSGLVPRKYLWRHFETPSSSPEHAASPRARSTGAPI
jgi:zinc D-Ala-D-Ala carboxypeptidase